MDNNFKVLKLTIINNNDQLDVHVAKHNEGRTLKIQK